MSADPPRKRRSSLSGHFQRVFHVDSAEKKRRNLLQETSKTESHLSWAPGDDQGPKSETTAPQSVPDETGISSLTFSSNSRITTLSTPGSTPSVQHFFPKDEDSTPQPMPEINNPNADRDNICSSPTWGKENARKERRATKRLEAERKELEKRLLQLEESQARLDNGIYDRNSRRLTKKNPPPSSERSSSAGSARGRLRSSSITAFFTGSRRASRSRASSANADDRHSASGTSGEGGRGGPPGPPAIGLALPERFGADVSRELANRHGTTLVPVSQLSLTKNFTSQQQSSRDSLQLQRSLHSTMKSDDLRENWRMAEAWQKGNGGRNSSSESLARKLDVLAGGQSRHQSNSTIKLAAVDRDLVPTNTKEEIKKPSKTSKPSTGSPKIEKPSHQPRGLLPKKSPRSDNTQALNDPSTPRITTACQLRDLSNAVPESGQTPRSASTNDIQSLTSLLDSISSNVPRKSRVEASSPTYPRAYKSSPLAMNPNNPENYDNSPKENSQMQSHPVQVPQPLRIGKHSKPEESRERNRQSAPARSWGISQNRSSPTSNSPDTRNQINSENRRSRIIPPAKHPGRRSLDDHHDIPKTGNNNNAHSTIPATLLISPPHGSEESKDKYTLTPKEVFEDKQTTEPWNEADHPRPPSRNSSHAASSYDTADEEVLDVPSKSPNHPQANPTKQPIKKPSAPPTEMSTTKPQSLPPPNLRNNPPLAPGGGPLSMLRRKPMQKVKPPRSDDVVAKLFVICCQCKYWHDMPSEVYAKLACPERLPSESRLVRTFSRKNSGRNSIFSADPNDTRRIPVPRRMYPESGPRGATDGQGNGQSAPPTQPTPLYRPQCCWCAHNMSKTCCQGWSALVHMRERNH
ncbi:hypothetical protein N7478_009046 [Penicillium angulare]|uniref:uncharacterized protein n=1 Tax=Penicillium angulare TaxID=116970 RepID=UPI002540AD46|nr:uncharacterized protein N7478_009046 [Penicillium angulare]KAJ5273921.1 hypothetical protein N7478_009046 [Penicillium angulare]